MGESAGPGGNAALVEFIRYNNWANRLLLEAAQSLTIEQLNTGEPGAYGTIYETLRHIVHAEARYANRLQGHVPEPALDMEGSPSLAEVAAYAEQVGRDLLAAAEAYTPDHVVRQSFQGQPIAYHALALMIQIVNHGVEHRTNVTTILSQLGVEPPDLTGWGYLWAHNDRLGAPVEGE